MDSDNPLDEAGENVAPADAGNDAAPLDWQAIRRLYALDPRARMDLEGIKRAVIESDLSLARIGQAFGVSATTVAKRARSEGWKRKLPTKRLPSGRKQRGVGVAESKPPTAVQRRRRSMLKRLYRVLDEKIKVMEQRITLANEVGAPPQGAAEAERDARTLGALARLYAKLVELDESANKIGEESETAPEAASGVTNDADGFRRDLTLRLERLNWPGKA